MSKLIERQLKRLGVKEGEAPTPEQWVEFLALVQGAYDGYEEGNYLLERSLDLSSKEIQKYLESNRNNIMKLKEANRLATLGTLSSWVAHELNNPLSGILGHSEHLEGAPNLNEKQRRKVGRIISLSERMAVIVKQLLTLARKPHDKANAKTDIHSCVEEAIEISADQKKLEKIHLDIDIEKGKYLSVANHAQLVSVFQNLIDNACFEFEKKKGRGRKKDRLEIGIADEKSNSKNIVVYVKDTAGGIPEEIKEKIFTPFFTTKAEGAGTGLGLTMCMNSLKDIGGDLSVDSCEDEGETTFYIHLPLAHEDQRVDISDMARANFPRLPQNKMNVLLVDDEEDVLELLAGRLGPIMNLEKSLCPMNALNYLKGQKVDLLITDLKMPGMTGDQLIEHARELYPDLPVAVVSGNAYAGKELRKKTVFSNVIFIDKPIPKRIEFMKLLDQAIDLMKEEVPKAG